MCLVYTGRYACFAAAWLLVDGKPSSNWQSYNLAPVKIGKEMLIHHARQNSEGRTMGRRQQREMYAQIYTMNSAREAANEGKGRYEGADSQVPSASTKSRGMPPWHGTASAKDSRSDHLGAHTNLSSYCVLQANDYMISDAYLNMEV